MPATFGLQRWQKAISSFYLLKVPLVLYGVILDPQPKGKLLQLDQKKRQLVYWDEIEPILTVQWFSLWWKERPIPVGPHNRLVAIKLGLSDTMYIIS